MFVCLVWALQRRGSLPDVNVPDSTHHRPVKLPCTVTRLRVNHAQHQRETDFLCSEVKQTSQSYFCLPGRIRTTYCVLPPPLAPLSGPNTPETRTACRAPTAASPPSAQPSVLTGKLLTTTQRYTWSMFRFAFQRIMSIKCIWLFYSRSKNINKTIFIID